MAAPDILQAPAKPASTPLQLRWTGTREGLIAAGISALAFVILFARPAQLLFDAWWNDPNSGHGLLLGPLSLWLAWKAGKAPGAKAQPIFGIAVLLAAVVFRYAADLAAATTDLQARYAKKRCSLN